VDLTTELSFRLDPARLIVEAGLEPDPWQVQALRSEARRTLVLRARQAGKSTTTACIALHAAMFQPYSLTLLLSRTERQSGEIYAKVRQAYERLGRPIEAVRELALSMELANGSRVIALPGDPEGLRGYSGPSLIVVDEASIVEDRLFIACLPMLAVSQGRLICLSTPFGRRGWFFEQWQSAGEDWERILVTAESCPRISREFLEEQKRLLGPRWYAQEFLCEFVEAIDQVFSSESIESIFHDADSEIPALIGV
jgi:hypothetical protein